MRGARARAAVQAGLACLRLEGGLATCGPACFRRLQPAMRHSGGKAAACRFVRHALCACRVRREGAAAATDLVKPDWVRYTFDVPWPAVRCKAVGTAWQPMYNAILYRGAPLGFVKHDAGGVQQRAGKSLLQRRAQCELMGSITGRRGRGYSQAGGQVLCTSRCSLELAFCHHSQRWPPSGVQRQGFAVFERRSQVLR